MSEVDSGLDIKRKKKSIRSPTAIPAIRATKMTMNNFLFFFFII